MTVKDGLGGATALVYAALHGHTTIVQALLEKGADPNAKDNVGMTALMAAVSRGHADVIQLLQEVGAKE